MILSPKRAVAAAILATLTLGAAAVQASEEGVKKGIEAFIGAPAVEAVTRVGYGELYEVILKSGELVYTDAKVSFIIDGRIIDTRTRSDVTEARLNQLASIDFSSLPLERAIKQVKGNGKRVIASFEDPNCAFCKRLAAEFEKMDDVTIYTFLYPLLGPDSVAKSADIWCAKDRAKTWNDWIVGGKVPAKASCDTSAVDANVALGRELRINGTPTMFLADGRRIGGYVPAAQLEQALSAVGK